MNEDERPPTPGEWAFVALVWIGAWALILALGYTFFQWVGYL